MARSGSFCPGGRASGLRSCPSAKNRCGFFRPLLHRISDLIQHDAAPDFLVVDLDAFEHHIRIIDLTKNIDVLSEEWMLGDIKGILSRDGPDSHGGEA